MSTHEEIMAEFERDISQKTRLVVARKGIGVLMEGASGMHVESLFGEATGDGEMVRDFSVGSRERE